MRTLELGTRCRRWLAAGLLVCAAGHAAAAQITVQAAAGLQAQEPGWNLTALPLLLDLDSNTEIGEILQHVVDAGSGFDLAEMLLSFNQVALLIDRTMADYNIQPGSVLVLSSLAPAASQVPEPGLPGLLGLAALAATAARRRNA